MRSNHYRRRVFIQTNNETNKQEESSFNWFDTGLLISILTVLGYFVAYSYQKGYLMFYGISEVFLNQITIVNVIISISVVGSALFFGITTYDSFKRIIPESNNPFWQVFKKSFTPYLFVALITFPFTYEYIKFVIYCLIGLLLIIYVFPFFTQWNERGYLNKLRKQLQQEDETRITTKSIVTAWRLFPSSRVFSLMVVFLILPIVSSLFGYKNAENTKYYFIFENLSNNHLVVIDKIGENFIVAPIDLKKQEIKKQYQVIEQKSDLENPIVFEKVKIDGGINVINEKKY